MMTSTRIAGFFLIFAATILAPDVPFAQDIKDESFAGKPIYSRVNINVSDVRAEPKRRSERVSQILYNELVEIIEDQERYCRIRQKDGYTGWVRKQFLSEHDGFQGDGPFIVVENLATGMLKPDPSSKRVTSIPFGCLLYGQEMNGFLKISSERYGEFFINSEDYLDIKKIYKGAGLDSASIAIEGNKFLGAPYLWGGRSFFGIDCSGFVQTIMNRFNIALPRDSKDQIRAGVEIRRKDIRAGDLLFFPRHVTLALSRDLMIHSTPSNGGVAYNSLDPQSPIYSKYHDESFITARRVLE
jgi:hypothetical protein